MDLPEGLQTFVNTVVGAVGGAAFSYLGLRRKYSQDTTGIARDKAESTLMATLIAERDEAMRAAREAWNQRTEDAKKIARLEALLEANDRETSRLRDELFALRLQTRKLTSIIVRLDPQAAALLELDQPSPDGIAPLPVNTPKGHV